MSKMKDLLTEGIEALCERTGYDFDFLMEQWFVYTEECAEAGDEYSWNFFRAVSLERDW